MRWCFMLRMYKVFLKTIDIAIAVLGQSYAKTASNILTFGRLHISSTNAGTEHLYVFLFSEDVAFLWSMVNREIDISVAFFGIDLERSQLAMLERHYTKGHRLRDHCNIVDTLKVSWSTYKQITTEFLGDFDNKKEMAS